MNPVQPSKWFVTGMLLVAAGLVAVSCWLGSAFKIDNPAVQYSRSKRMWISEQEVISSAWNCVICRTAKTGEIIWSVETPGTFFDFVADRFLVRVSNGRVDAIDLHQALAAPIAPDDRFKKRQVRLDVFGLAHEELPVRPLGQVMHAVPIPNTDRFLIEASTTPQTARTVFAFAIQPGTIRYLGQWSCSMDGVAITGSGLIGSLTPNRTAMELRRPQDLVVQSSLDFTPEAIGGVVTMGNDLFSYFDTATGQVKVCHVTDLSPIPVDGLSIRHSRDVGLAKDRRYTILTDQAGPWAVRRLLVYDSDQRRVAYDSGPCHGFLATNIENGVLRLSTHTFGLTTTEVDLSDGTVQRIERPFLWLIVGMGCVLLSGLCWLIVWLRLVRVTGWRLALNIGVVATLFLLPLCWRVRSSGFYQWGMHPTMGYIFGVALALGFVLALYAIYGAGRPMLRIVPWIVSMSLIMILLEMVRLLDFENTHVAVGFQVWVVGGVLTLLALGVLRWLGWRPVSWSVAAISRQGGAPRFRLLDIFVLTAAVALAVAVFRARVPLLLDSTYGWYAAERAALYTAMTMLGLLALTGHAVIYRGSVWLVIWLAVVGIVDILAHVSLEQLRASAWYQVAGQLRTPVFTSLASFALCLMIRQGSDYVRRGQDRAALNAGASSYAEITP